MYDLSRIFKPIPAFINNKHNYQEVMPCNSLQPFIRCFWMTHHRESDTYSDNFTSYAEFVIPDACMDIVFEINDMKNIIQDVFCGINNVPFSVQVKEDPNVSRFAIRFNFWGAYHFIDRNMRNTLNGFLIVEEYFGNLNKEFKRILIENKSFYDRVQEIEKLLIKRLFSRYQLNNNFENAVYYLLSTKGVITVSELCKKTNISDRQLERLFLEYTGASPKKIADIVRFQNILQDLFLSKNCNQQDIIFNYKFYDQSHLINNFKKYSGITPHEVIQQLKTANFYNTY